MTTHNAPQIISATPSAKSYLSDQGLAARYKCAPRTIKRWKKDSKLEFPPPDLIINGREYRETNIENWERRRATASTP